MGWQPIETAPDDETDVLVWSDDEERGVFRCRVAMQDHKGNWWTPDPSYGDYSAIRRPTHWMPLPEGPK